MKTATGLPALHLSRSRFFGNSSLICHSLGGIDDGFVVSVIFGFAMVLHLAAAFGLAMVLDFNFGVIFRLCYNIGFGKFWL